MKIAILIDRPRWEEKRLLDAALKKGLKPILLNLNEIILDLSRIQFDDYDLVLQRCISHYHGLYASKILEDVGLKVMNKFSVSAILGNKLFLTLLLNKAGIKTPRTYIAFDREKAEEAIEKLDFRAVVKPLVGSWGRYVTPIFSKQEMKPILDLFDNIMHPPNNVYYVQELVERPPRDIRMIIAGKDIIACVYRNSKEGVWATNVAQGAITTPCELNEELKSLAEKISKTLNGGIFGIDVMESKEGYLVNDVNPTPEFKGAQACTAHDIAEKIIEYVVNG
ncbi:MAG TPA: RimK family alpha-L-glutamate ligase [Geobacterales bacterium]|nr:RimK family alpha-L-glutamate ligase [Geobacterales bacterium]